MKATMYQHLRAPNDTNGNPRRVYVLIDKLGCIVLAIDEGYSGMPKVCRGLVELPSYDITATDYHALLKQWGTK